jgi:A/G-specific adenine glycosylase
VNESLILFRRRLLAWYDRHQRSLPWRPAAGAAASSPPDPYHVLVSELMLQQTQVATVIPYFQRFIERLPTLSALAKAPEGEVLRLWQGLGYYSRARNLQRAAQKAVAEFDGRLPSTVDELRQLPGVGRYTAGAIASIAFGRRAPILDGNVMRVLCRLDKVTSDPRERATQEVLWARAEEILPRNRLSDFNSALMEVGALVCTPRAPQCLLCPVRQHCEAYAAGVQEQIPPPKKAKPTPLLRRRTFCIRRGARWLIEQRPAKGRWAGMWQFLTLETDETLSRKRAAEQLPFPVSDVRYLGTVTHGLTHRRYEFEAFAARVKGLHGAPPPGPTRRWVTLGEMDELAFPRPQLAIRKWLQNGEE